MRVYVWRGERVLKNYATGMVVVCAGSPAEAWTKLKAQNFRAWAWLTFGISYIDAVEELGRLDADDYPANWQAPQPEVFEPADLPVLVQWGGE